MTIVVASVLYEGLDVLSTSDWGHGAKFQGFGIASVGAAFPTCAFADWEEIQYLRKPEKTCGGDSDAIA